MLLSPGLMLLTNCNAFVSLDVKPINIVLVLMLLNQLGTRGSPCRCYWLCLLMVNIYLFTLIAFLLTWPAPHPKYVAAGTCQYSVKGWVIDSNQHSLSDCSSHALVIPAHNAEIVQGHFMTSGLKVVIDGWWWPQVFPESFSKCSAWLPYAFILTVHPTTLVPVYHPTLLQYVIFGLLGGQGAAWWYWLL